MSAASNDLGISRTRSTSDPLKKEQRNSTEFFVNESLKESPQLETTKEIQFAKIDKESTVILNEETQKTANFSLSKLSKNSTSTSQSELPDISINSPVAPVVLSQNLENQPPRSPKLSQRSQSARFPKPNPKELTHEISHKQFNRDKSLSLKESKTSQEKNPVDKLKKSQTTSNDTKWWNFLVPRSKQDKNNEDEKVSTKTKKSSKDEDIVSHPLPSSLTSPHSSKDKGPSLTDSQAMKGREAIALLKTPLIPFHHWSETIVNKVYMTCVKIYKKELLQNVDCDVVVIIKNVLNQFQHEPLKYASNFEIRVTEFLATVEEPQAYEFLNSLINITTPEQLERAIKHWGEKEKDIVHKLSGDLVNCIRLKQGKYKWIEKIGKLFSYQADLEKSIKYSCTVPLGREIYPIKYIDISSVTSSYRSYFDICKKAPTNRNEDFEKDLSPIFFPQFVQLGCITMNGCPLNLPYKEDDGEAQQAFLEHLLEVLNKEWTKNFKNEMQKIYQPHEQFCFLNSIFMKEEERVFIRDTLQQWLVPFIEKIKYVHEKKLHEYLDRFLPEIFNEKSLLEALQPVKEKYPHHVNYLIQAILNDEYGFDKLKCDVSQSNDVTITAGLWATDLCTTYAKFCSYEILKATIPCILALKASSFSAYSAAAFDLQKQFKFLQQKQFEIGVDRSGEVPNVTRLDFIIDSDAKKFEVIQTKQYIILEKENASDKGVGAVNKVRFKSVWKISANFDGSNMGGHRQIVEPYFSPGCSEKFMNEILECLKRTDKDLKNTANPMKSISVNN